MSSWEGKTRGGVLGYQIFIFLLRKFGLGAAYTLLVFVAFYFVLFAPKSSRSIFFYFRRILNYDMLRSLVSVYRSYYVFGQTIIDKVAVISGVETKLTFEFDGEENLHAMQKNQTGGLLISAHLGNWEIAGQLLKRINAKIHVVMFDAEHQQIKKMLSDVSFKRNMNVIVIKNDLSHIFEISKAIQNKELVCIHGDRFVKGSKFITCDFFGRKANFPRGPFEIATKLKVPYTFVFAVKDSNFHYHLYSTPGKINTGTAETLAQEYVTNLEKMVQHYPLQWFNYYDFWKKDTA